MTDVLARIAAYKREEVAAAKARAPQAAIEAAATTADSPRGFTRALTAQGSVPLPRSGGGGPAGVGGGSALAPSVASGDVSPASGRETASSRAHPPALIAEIKRASPSKGLIRADFDPPALARAYAAGGAACLSVLTDGPSFGGNPAFLKAARDACALPCLRKDFLVDPWQVAESRALGADAILVILAMVDDALAAELLAETGRWSMDALVEVHDEAEMARAAALGAGLIGVNNRDLRSFHVDLAVTERLAPLRPADSLFVAESGIFTPADVARVADAGAAAVLVGESLMRQLDVEKATRQLLGRG